MPNHLDLLNYIAVTREAKSYLEIGIGDGANFRQVNVAEKIAVDPFSEETGIVCATSDEYFRRCDRKFDLVFIDGDHRCEFALRDTLNALDHLAEGGAIVLHDCLPGAIEQTRKNEGSYTGDVWRVIASLARSPRLDVVVGDFDWGCAVVLPRRNPCPSQLLPSILPSIRSWTWEQYASGTLFRVLSWPELCVWLGSGKLVYAN